MNKKFDIETLQKVRSIMETMLVQAETENWPELAALDERRRTLLEYSGAQPVVEQVNKIFSNTMPSPLRSTGSASSEWGNNYAQLCDQILVLDMKINKTVESVRLSLVKEKRGLQAQVSAKRNYAQVCSGHTKTYG